jgi:transposase InsO family protein
VEGTARARHSLGKDRVQRLMKMHGIKARGKRKFVISTDSRHDLPVAPNLLARDFSPAAPDQVWSSDFTYIATDEGWLYLAAVIDLFSRQVVGWSMQPHCRRAWSRTRCAWRGSGVTRRLGWSSTRTGAANTAVTRFRPRWPATACVRR